MGTTLQIDGRTLITCQDAARLYGCTMGYMRRLARDGRSMLVWLAARTWSTLTRCGNLPRPAAAWPRDSRQT